MATLVKTILSPDPAMRNQALEAVAAKFSMRELLRECAAGFCNIDQPVIGKSMEPSAEVTGPIGYVRLHGRRYDTWFNDEATIPSFERYNYLYSEEELRKESEAFDNVRPGEDMVGLERAFQAAEEEYARKWG